MPLYDNNIFWVEVELKTYKEEIPNKNLVNFSDDIEVLETCEIKYVPTKYGFAYFTQMFKLKFLAVRTTHFTDQKLGTVLELFPNLPSGKFRVYEGDKDALVERPFYHRN